MKPQLLKIWSCALLTTTLTLSGAQAQGNGVGNGGEVEVGAKFASIANHIRVLFNTTDLKDVIGKEYPLDQLVADLQVRRSNTPLTDASGASVPFLNQKKDKLPLSLVNGNIWSSMNCKSRNYLVIHSLLKHLQLDKGNSSFKTEQVYQYLNSKKQLTCDGIDAPQGENADYYQRNVQAEFFHLAHKLTRLEISKDLNPLLKKLQVKEAKGLTTPDHYPVDGWSSIENGVPFTRIDGSRWKEMDCRDRFFLTLHELYVNLKFERSLSYDRSSPAIERLQKQNLLNCNFNVPAAVGNGDRSFKTGAAVDLSKQFYALDIPGLNYDRTQFASILKSGGGAATQVPVTFTHDGLNAILAQAKLKDVSYYRSVILQIESSVYVQSKRESSWWYISFDTRTAAATYTAAAHGEVKDPGTTELGQFLQAKQGPVTIQLAVNPLTPKDGDVYSGQFIAQSSPIQLDLPLSLKITPDQVSRVQLLHDFVPDLSAAFSQACGVKWGNTDPNWQKGFKYVCEKRNPEEMMKRFRVRVYFNDANGNRRYVTYQNKPAYENFKYSDGYLSLQGIRASSTEAEWDRWIYGNYPERLVERILTGAPEGFTLELDASASIGYEGDAGDLTEMRTETASTVNSSNWH